MSAPSQPFPFQLRQVLPSRAMTTTRFRGISWDVWKLPPSPAAPRLGGPLQKGPCDVDYSGGGSQHSERRPLRLLSPGRARVTVDVPPPQGSLALGALSVAAVVGIGSSTGRQEHSSDVGHRAVSPARAAKPAPSPPRGQCNRRAPGWGTCLVPREIERRLLQGLYRQSHMQMDPE